MNPTTQFKIMAVESTYDRPFWPLLRDLLGQGLSHLRIAEVISYDRTCLDRVVRKYAPGDVKEAWDRNRRKGRSDSKINIQDYPKLLKLYEHMPASRLSERFGMTESGIRKAIYRARLAVQEGNTGLGGARRD